MKQAESEVMMGDEQPRDRKGRRRYTQERRTELVREHAGSGLTQAEFARREGLNFTTFAHWVQQARKRQVGAPRFVEVQASLPKAHQAAEVSAALSATLPDGVVLRGSDPLTLAALLQALRTS